MSDECLLCEEMIFLQRGGESLQNIALRLSVSLNTLYKHRRLCAPEHPIARPGRKPQAFCKRGHDMSMTGRSHPCCRGRYCIECRRINDRFWRSGNNGEGKPEEMSAAQQKANLALGAWMRSVRTAAGYSQETFAERIEMTRLGVSMTERGTRRMRVDELITVCRAFNVKPPPVSPIGSIL